MSYYIIVSLLSWVSCCSVLSGQCLQLLTFLLHLICRVRGKSWIRQQAVCPRSRGERYLTHMEGYNFLRNILVPLQAVCFLLTFWEESHVRLVDPLHLNQRPQDLHGIGKIISVPKYRAMYAYI